MFENLHENIKLIDDKKGIVKKRDIEAYFDLMDSFFIEPGIVLLCTSNCLLDIIVYIYCVRTRRPIMLVSEDITTSELKVVIKSFQPKFLVTEKKLSFNVSRTFDDKQIYKFPRGSRYNEKLALLLSTSGSTGKSKFVRISHTNLRVNTEDIVKFLNINSQEVAVTSLPINYTYGLSVVNTTLSVGGTLLITNKSIMQREFWDVFLRYEVTSFSGVPYTYEMLNYLKFYQKEFPNLRVMTQAGGHLSDKLKKQFLKYCLSKNIQFFVMYGQVEATSRMSYVPPKLLPQKIASVGIAVPSGELSIESPNQNGIGDIIFKGLNVSLGYAENKKDLILGDQNNGYLNTGDMGFIDSDGYLFITGRKKRFLKIYGVRFGLDQVESILEERFYPDEFLCSGTDNNIVVNTSGFSSEKKIKQYLIETLKINNSAIVVKKIKKLERNSAGKKLYR